MDSEAASTQSGTNATETYLNQIRQIIDIARRYHTIPEPDHFMDYFGAISEDRWREIETNPPEHLNDLITN